PSSSCASGTPVICMGDSLLWFRQNGQNCRRRCGLSLINAIWHWEVLRRQKRSHQRISINLQKDKDGPCDKRSVGFFAIVLGECLGLLPLDVGQDQDRFLIWEHLEKNNATNSFVVAPCLEIWQSWNTSLIHSSRNVPKKLVYR